MSLDSDHEALADAADLRRKWERENAAPESRSDEELVRRLRASVRLMDAMLDEYRTPRFRNLIAGWADLMRRAADELERGQR